LTVHYEHMRQSGFCFGWWVCERGEYKTRLLSYVGLILIMKIEDQKIVEL